ncbi:MAG: histidinol-phosphate transaminase [Bacillota bacterium]
MRSINELVRSELLALQPYHVPVYPGMIKLDANENNYDFPEQVLEEVLSTIGGQTFGRYPDPSALQLRESLSRYTGVDRNRITVGNGSDELILNLMLAFAAGGKVVICTPTFTMYGIHAVIAGAEPVALPRKADFSVDPDAVIEAAARPGVKMVVLCSPNNPTGNTIPLEVTEKILKHTRAVVVLDEAYYEFCGETAVSLLGKYPQLVLLRTFSKAFGLAGLRLGYMLAGPEVTGVIQRIKQPFNVNAFTQQAAIRVLEWQPLFERRVRQICRSRDELFAAMRYLPGLTVYPSRANFLLFRTGMPAQQVFSGLLQRGVLVRLLDGPDLPGCLRVSVGRPEENLVFCNRLADVLRTG